MRVLSMRALFEDPIEAEDFKGYCDCEDCPKCNDYLSIDFPIDNDMVDVLVEMAVNELVILFSQSIEDATNDTRDNIKEQSK